MQDEFFTVQLAKQEIYRNITQQVQELIQGWDMDEGHILIFVEHTTCALILQEDEPCLIQDMFDRLDVIAPSSDRRAFKVEGSLQYYRHDDLAVRTVNVESATEERINGHAHIRALLLGPSVTLRVQDGDLHLGRWQQVLFFDFDNLADRRERTISVSVIGG